ncbi:MAG: septal ring lytic transglycosylase RlpA family protein [Desulfobulbaceae bacterium]|nr:septal ring lytic transglycosylase RlpA family protein [Desulfobulbaceae bacterium]
MLSAIDVIKGRRAFGILMMLLFLGGMLVGCGGHQNGIVRSSGKVEKGKASYYAMKYQFSKTASGERFNNWGYTAAHRTLAFGTKVRVINRKNRKYVDVRINDRGPFVKGRIIDLSRAAFAKIGDIKRGVADVEVWLLD